MASRTVGIDLSAQPKKTAACVIEWAEIAHLMYLKGGATDDDLIAVVQRYVPTKAAIDSPFGWPSAFVSAVADFAHLATWPVGCDRRTLLLRATDFVVKEETGREPLSVSSDRIAVCAMRCAELLTRLSRDYAIERAGTGLVVEAYPAAALRQWGLDPRGYKGTTPEKVHKKEQLVDEVVAATSQWLALTTDQIALLKCSDHMLDALICAFVARSVELGQALPIPRHLRDLAEREGWIHLPRAEPLAQFRAFQRPYVSRE
jgi:predicted nuclease with RNAse H fold